MPEGAKVGEVYVEGSLEYDGSKTPAFMGALQRDIRRHLPDITRDLKSSFSTPIREGIGDGVNEGMDNAVRSASRDIPRRHGPTVAGIGRALGAIMAINIGFGLSSAASVIRDALVLSMAGFGVLVVATLGAAFEAALAFVPPILASLPGLFIGAALGVGVLAIAVSGVGNALKKAFTEDFSDAGNKRFNDAIAGMSENFQAFASEVRANVGVFQEFRNTLQDAFFNHDPTEVINRIKNALDALEPSAAKVSNAFGNLTFHTIEWATSSSALENWNTILKAVEQVLAGIEKALIRVFDALLSKGAEATGFTQQFIDLLNRVLNGIADWLEKKSLKQWFEEAKPEMEDVKRIAEAIKGIFQNLFGDNDDGKNDENEGFLEFLADLMEALERASAKIKEFKQAIENTSPAVKELAIGIGAAALAGAGLKAIAGPANAAGAAVSSLATAMSALGLSSGVIGGIFLGLAAVLLLLGGIFLIAWFRSEEFREQIKKIGGDVKKFWEEQLKPALEELKAKWDEAMDKIEKAMAEIGMDWGDLGAIIRAVVIGILIFVVMIIMAIGNFLDALGRVASFIGGALDWVQDRWKQFRDWLNNGLMEMGEDITAFKDNWKSKIEDATRAIGNFATDIKDRVTGIVGGGLQAIKDGAGSFKDFWVDKWNAARQGAEDAASAIGNGVKNTLTGFFDGVRDRLGSWGEDWRGKFENVKNWAHDTANNIGDSVRGKFTGFFDGVRDRLGSFTDDWRGKVDNVRGKIDDAANFFKNDVLGKIKDFFGSMESRAESFRGAFENVWNKIRDTVKAPIRAIVQFINDPLIKGYNIVAKAVNLGEITPIAIPFARGGMVPGVGNGDTVPAMLTPGEGVLTKAEVKRLGGPQGFHQFRHMLQYFASGGIVKTLTDLFKDGGLIGSIPGGSIAGFTGQQLANAAAIVNVGKSLGVPPQGWVVAVATAMQESGLMNLNYGDRDSVGLFQQRPSQGWGSVAQIMNPIYSATKFFQGLKAVGNWMRLPLTAAAQAVQRSAFPGAYAKWAGPAAQVVARVAGGDLGGLLDFFTDPVKGFINGMIKELPNLGGAGRFGEILVGMAKKIIDAAANFIMPKTFFSMTGDPSGALGGLGRGVEAIIILVNKLSKQLGVGYRVTSTFRPGDPGYHGRGRAVDFGGHNQDKLAGALYALGGNLLELIHTTNTRGYYIKNGRPIRSYGVQDELHRDHIHVAMDQGGALGPGRTIVDNFTGKPEAVLNPRQAAFVGRVLSGENLVVEVHNYLDGTPVRNIARQEIIMKAKEDARLAKAGRRI